MPKRRISQQQTLRIKAMHERSRTRAADTQELGEEQQGLLITHYGRYVDVEDQEDAIHRCNLRQSIEPLAVGDQVIWQLTQNQTGVVTAISPRKSVIWRTDDRGNSKPMAANLDQAIIVIAPTPAPTPTLIDSYFVAMEYLNITPLLLLNKIDLLGDKQHAFKTLLSVYEKIGYQCFAASAINQQGLDALKLILKDRSSIFVGQSGVGKSSLLRLLMPGAEIAVGMVSDRTGHGAHTTTRSHLYHLPSGGDLIDSPGIRDFKLMPLEPQEIAQGFIEFRDYLQQCKFHNCLHLHEPNCAVLKASSAGKISLTRLASYHELIKNVR